MFNPIHSQSCVHFIALKNVDECVTEKPCDQLCRNLPGTYECHCRPGFQLQKDGQSCRKNDTEDTAFEARDLENDFHETTTTKRPTVSSHDTENEVADDDLDQDYEIILKRLTKLEKVCRTMACRIFDL
ncbi:hypothetical protein K0M31_002739 [Melipona bicolor]|uniref:EGF-like domain-containing protein n=1 Tax=Melipona bicolor TaxID=60889 RepID=A0AA40G038_9HYME|nr:hypothetical protein K0M31_002739 [Melipona bicolor]